MGGRGSSSTKTNVGGFSFRDASGRFVEYNRNSMGVVFKNGRYDSELTKNPKAYEAIENYAKKATTYKKLSDSYFQQKERQRAEDYKNKEDYELNPQGLSRLGRKQRGRTIRKRWCRNGLNYELVKRGLNVRTY